MGADGYESIVGWRERLFLRLEEAALILGVSARTVRRLIAMKELAEPVKIRRSSRLRVSDVVAYEERLRGVK